MSVRNRLRGLKMKATSRLKQGKAALGKFNFTSARKAALKKAQEASARARKLAGSSKDRQMAIKGAGMKARSKAKQTAAAARSAVAKGKSAASKSFAAAGGNTAALRAKMKVKRTVSKAKAYGSSAAAIAKNKASKVKAPSVRNLKDKLGISETAKLRRQMEKQKKAKAKAIDKSVKLTKFSAKYGGGSIQKAGQVSDFLTKKGVYSQYASPEQKRARESLTQKKNRSTKKKK